MECPFCSQDNIDGVDECARCGVDLTFLGQLTDRSDIERRLLTEPLGNLATRDYLEIAPDCTVAEAVRRWTETGHHCALVLENQSIVGIFTERDVLYKLAGDFEQHAREPVSKYMTTNPETFDTHVPIAFGLNRMMVGDYRHVPITENGALTGVVSVRDVLGFMAQEFSDVIGNEA